MINATEDAVWELQDQVQRVERMVAWLVRSAGGDPAVIGDIVRGAAPEGAVAA